MNHLVADLASAHYQDLPALPLTAIPIVRTESLPPGNYEVRAYGAPVAIKLGSEPDESDPRIVEAAPARMRIDGALALYSPTTVDAKVWIFRLVDA